MLGLLYDKITGDKDGRVCKDIPQAACPHQRRNFSAYLIANFFNKVADELASARLILPWLLSAIGAPAAFVGFLVPIREAGVLIPQLAVAAYVRQMTKRKSVWLLGATLSAASLLLMAMAASTFTGSQAGWAIILMLALYSLARGLCSVSSKDVLGKTVSKTHRGKLMGYSTAAAGVVTLAIGLLVEWLGEATLGSKFFMAFLLLAAAMWILAVFMFASIKEPAGVIDNERNAFAQAVGSLSIVVSDTHFRRFLVARALLLSCALMPPFFVLMAQRASEGLMGLGLLIIANGLASTISAPLWGRLGDRSSRWTMVLGSVGAGMLALLTWGAYRADIILMHSVWVYVALFLLLGVCYNGVRLGRKVYLVDMSNQTNRATYVAVSNTVIGGVMLLAGSFGVLADWYSAATVVGLLGALALASSLYIARLPEVSG